MGEFVRRQKIRLYVLSPKSPKLNGAVERCNPAWRYEFYSVYDLPRNAEAINRILDAFHHLYNHRRPHTGTLGELAPAQCLAELKAKDTCCLKGALDIPL